MRLLCEWLDVVVSLLLDWTVLYCTFLVHEHDRTSLFFKEVVMWFVTDTCESQSAVLHTQYLVNRNVAVSLTSFRMSARYMS